MKYEIILLSYLQLKNVQMLLKRRRESSLRTVPTAALGGALNINVCIKHTASML